MDFQQLEQEYRDEHIAAAMYAREMEWYHYEVDRRNFVEMLKVLPPGDYRQMIQTKLDDTVAQMRCVDLVYDALKMQVRNPQAHAAAVERLRAKRKAQE